MALLTAAELLRWYPKPRLPLRRRPGLPVGVPELPRKRPGVLQTFMEGLEAPGYAIRAALPIRVKSEGGWLPSDVELKWPNIPAVITNIADFLKIAPDVVASALGADIRITPKKWKETGGVLWDIATHPGTWVGLPVATGAKAALKMPALLKGVTKPAELKVASGFLRSALTPAGRRALATETEAILKKLPAMGVTPTRTAAQAARIAEEKVLRGWARTGLERLPKQWVGQGGIEFRPLWPLRKIPGMPEPFTIAFAGKDIGKYMPIATTGALLGRIPGMRELGKAVKAKLLGVESILPTEYERYAYSVGQARKRRADVMVPREIKEIYKDISPQEAENITSALFGYAPKAGMAASRAQLAELFPGNPAVLAAFDKSVELGQKMVRDLVDIGRISKATAAKWQANPWHYVPLQLNPELYERFFDPEVFMLFSKARAVAKKKGTNPLQEFIKRLTPDIKKFFGAGVTPANLAELDIRKLMAQRLWAHEYQMANMEQVRLLNQLMGKGWYTKEKIYTLPRKLIVAPKGYRLPIESVTPEGRAWAKLWLSKPPPLPPLPSVRGRLFVPHRPTGVVFVGPRVRKPPLKEEKLPVRSVEGLLLTPPPTKRPTRLFPPLRVKRGKPLPKRVEPPTPSLKGQLLGPHHFVGSFFAPPKVSKPLVLSLKGRVFFSPPPTRRVGRLFPPLVVSQAPFVARVPRFLAHLPPRGWVPGKGPHRPLPTPQEIPRRVRPPKPRLKLLKGREITFHQPIVRRIEERVTGELADFIRGEGVWRGRPRGRMSEPGYLEKIIASINEKLMLKAWLTTGVAFIPRVSFFVRNMMAGVMQAAYDENIGVGPGVKAVGEVVGRVIRAVPGIGGKYRTRLDMILSARTPQEIKALRGIRVGNYTGDEIHRAFTEEGIIGGGFARKELLDDTKTLLEDKTAWQRLRDWPLTIHTGVEERMRGTTFLRFLEKGFDTREAGRRVRRMFVDYDVPSDLSRLVRHLVPFAQFTIGTLPVLAERASRAPGLFTVPRALVTGLAEKGIIPPYLAGEATVPLGERKRVLGFGLPTDVISQVGGLRPALTMLHPALRVPVEIATERELFTGREIAGRARAPGFAKYLPRFMTGYREVPTIGGEKYATVSPWVGYAWRQLPISPPILTPIDKWLDTRRTLVDKILNTITGIRTITIDKDRVLRQAVRDLLQEEWEKGNVKQVIRFFAMEEDQLGPDVSPEMAQKIRELVAYLNQPMRGKMEKKRTQRAQIATP